MLAMKSTRSSSGPHAQTSQRQLNTRNPQDLFTDCNASIFLDLTDCVDKFSAGKSGIPCWINSIVA
jgi:hypothetical protein